VPFGAESQEEAIISATTDWLYAPLQPPRRPESITQSKKRLASASPFGTGTIEFFVDIYTAIALIAFLNPLPLAIRTQELATDLVPF
jgi:hypothetical protein